MTMIYVVVQENQNEHGYTDASVAGAFTDEAEAQAAIHDWETADLADGEAVEGREEEWLAPVAARDECYWTVSYSIEATELHISSGVVLIAERS